MCLYNIINQKRKKESCLLGHNIALVAHQRDADIGRGELSRLVQPAAKVVEGLSPGHVEH